MCIHAAVIWYIGQSNIYTNVPMPGNAVNKGKRRGMDGQYGTFITWIMAQMRQEETGSERIRENLSGK